MQVERSNIGTQAEEEFDAQLLIACLTIMVFVAFKQIALPDPTWSPIHAFEHMVVVASVIQLTLVVIGYRTRVFRWLIGGMTIGAGLLPLLYFPAAIIADVFECRDWGLSPNHVLTLGGIFVGSAISWYLIHSLKYDQPIAQSELAVQNDK
ncbi:hypothetical protein HGA91_05450 [candidate division WWE3 bacterium]|nr:hypothetical protein [candidate division WWE3 bacterium]